MTVYEILSIAIRDERIILNEVYAYRIKHEDTYDNQKDELASHRFFPKDMLWGENTFVNLFI